MTDGVEWDLRFSRISDALDSLPDTPVTAVEALEQTPFSVLVSTIISLRTKDEVTLPASRRLLERAPRAETLASLREEEISKLIYPAGFYRTKAAQLRKTAQMIVDHHHGDVPSQMESLLAFPGVGRKTANLVLGMGFRIPAICVDTHVHRIPNRLGWIRTTSPEESEKALAELVPERFWIPMNPLLVKFGQRICTPVSPFCSTCPLAGECAQEGVPRHR